MLKDTLPEIYLGYFPKKLIEFEINEKKATCENCALSKGRSPDHRTYQPNLKCCTFHPFQTNYSIGQILTSRTTPPEVRQRIKEKIEKREYVLPIGIVAPLPFQFKFQNRKDSDFGNREDWLCPYYDRIKNNCGIWKSRNSVCTSFHCLSSYGKSGFEFWDQLSDYISYVEMALMEEVLLKMDFTPMEISEQVNYLNRTKFLPSEKKDFFLSEKLSRKLWKTHFEDQAGFYTKCFEIASNLSQYQFKKAIGDIGIEIQKKLMTRMKEVQL